MVKKYENQKWLDWEEEILGISCSLASYRLLKILILEAAKELKIHLCYRCGNEISSYKELSIDHKKSWMVSKEQEWNIDNFWDLDNIAFSHKHCNCASAQAYKGKSKYVGVNLFYDKRRNYKRWRSILAANGKKYCLGYFEREEDAAEARDLGVFKYNNGIGLLNFPERIDKYKQMIQNGWGEALKCKLCGYKHYGLGYCRKCYYYNCGGKEKRLKRYKEGKG